MAKPLSRSERRLGAFCRFFAAIYFLGAIGFAAFPRWTWRLVTLGGPSSFAAEAAFWNALAVAMMVAIATACALVASRPRERRHMLLPVIAAKLTSSVVAALQAASLGGPGARGLVAVILTDFPLFVISLLIYRAAAPGVHGDPEPESAPAPAPGAAPPAPAPPPVPLGLPK